MGWNGTSLTDDDTNDGIPDMACWLKIYHLELSTSERLDEVEINKTHALDGSWAQVTMGKPKRNACVLLVYSTDRLSRRWSRRFETDGHCLCMDPPPCFPTTYYPERPNVR
jgi:hypothetical protein